ncbi:MAG TPA: hypothetical protein PKW14_05610 [Bacteroidota bacterium]|jgi:hypothetical protein|nr:hypothetical protein [Bacteroidota bacterium]
MNIIFERTIRIVLGLIVFAIVYKCFPGESTLIRIIVFTIIYFPLVVLFNKYSSKNK